MPTMSSLPAAMAWRAVATSEMRAAWNTGNFVAARTSPAKSRCGEERMPVIGMTFVSAASVSIEPRMMFRKSNLPDAASRRAISTPSSFDRPFSKSSSATMRMPTMNSVADRLAHRVDHPPGEAQPVVERAAIFVVAPVGGRRPEAVHQMAVSLELDAVEARRLHPLRGSSIVGDDALDVPVLGLFGKARCAGSRTGEADEHRQPVGLVPAGAAAEMRELDHHLAVMLVAGVGKLPQPRHDLVAIGLQIAECGRAVARHDRRARGHRQRHAALGLFGVIEPVALLRHAVLGIGRLVAGRHDAVLQRQVLELVRLEKRVVAHTVRLCAATIILRLRRIGTALSTQLVNAYGVFPPTAG